MRISPRLFRDLLGLRVTLNILLPIVIFTIMVYFTLFYKPYKGLEVRTSLENSCSTHECISAVQTHFDSCIQHSTQEKLQEINTISSQLLSECINKRSGKRYF